jgi:hypothetical protein
MKQYLLSIVTILFSTILLTLSSVSAQEIKLKPLNEESKLRIKEFSKYVDNKRIAAVSGQFTCDREVCTCDSAPDCGDMLDTGLCGKRPIFVCGQVTCSCLRGGGGPIDWGIGGRDILDRIMPPG